MALPRSPQKIGTYPLEDVLPPPVSPLVGGGYSPSSSPKHVTSDESRRTSRLSASPMAVSKSDNAFGMIRSLIMGPPEPKVQEKVDFMQQLARPRVYKKWLNEIMGVLMDYFW
jgi:hypothetical protein